MPSESMASQGKRDIATTSTILVPYEPKRKALVICRPPTNEITVSYREAAVANQGIILDTTDPPLILSRALHGDLVRGPFYAISDTAAQVITYWETLSDDS